MDDISKDFYLECDSCILKWKVRGVSKGAHLSSEHTFCPGEPNNCLSGLNYTENWVR